MTVLAVLGLAIAAGVASVDEDPAGERTQALEAELAAKRERNAALATRIEELERRIKELEVERRLGSYPCLGMQPGSRHLFRDCGGRPGRLPSSALRSSAPQTVFDSSIANRERIHPPDPGVNAR